jgi:hypothetical protein
MKVLKFVLEGGTGPPEIEYLEETIGLGDVTNVSETSTFLSEILGLNDGNIVLTEESFTDTIGLGDTETIILPEEIAEILGLGDTTFTYNWVDVFESLGLGDAISNTMDIYVEIEENIGFTDGGYGYLVINYELRWRTRTKKSTYGYGVAPYGDQTSYGDGDVIGELKEFKVKVIRISDSTTLRTDTITIVNKSFPDGSAQYTYTAAMNVSDNGYFEPNLRFEVYQVDVDDNWSPVKYLDITASDEGGDLI